MAELTGQEPVQSNPLFVGSLERGFAVLEAFRATQREMGVSEIAMATGFDKSAAQRFAFTLHALGYLEKNPATRKYRLSHQVLGLSYTYLRANPLVEVATPYLADLRQACQCRVDLSILDRQQIIYLVRLQSRREAFGATLIGRRIPAFCSSGGRAMLARLPEDEARALIETSDRTPLTPHTVTDVDAIMAAIAHARHDGFAVSVQESLVGEIVVAAPVIDAEDRPRAAVHIAMPFAECDEDTIRARFAPMAIATARLIAGGG
ncbi:MAG: IclR family transcriptional regulator C-terminal domain-containing protein [Azospirillaceae bacterium]|nr:IclR family transcriptional regulator C-terminal domain-containing protein [Azospirillaceae bacterium]